MKKIILILMTATVLFACKKSDDPTPLVSAPSKPIKDTTTAPWDTNFVIKPNITYGLSKMTSFIYGHTWQMKYIDYSTGKSMETPAIYSDAGFNHLITNSDMSIKEYGYLVPAPYTGNGYYSSGIYQLQSNGSEFWINTNQLNNVSGYIRDVDFSKKTFNLMIPKSSSSFATNVVVQYERLD